MANAADDEGRDSTLPAPGSPDALEASVIEHEKLRLVPLLLNLVGWLWIIFTCIAWPVPVLSVQFCLFPFKLAYRWGDAATIFWLKVFRRLWRLEIDYAGLEHVERGQTYVLICNHRSHLDAVAAMLTLERHVRFGFVIKRALSLIPIWGWFIWFNGYFPVDRGRSKGNLDQLGTAVRYLKEGRSVLVYAEGTRSPDHRFLSFKKGAAMMAIRAGVPILPITVSGTARLWPKPSLFIRPGRVRVDIHPPISTEGLDVKDRDNIMGLAHDAIVGAYRRTLEEPPLDETPELRALLASRRPGRRKQE
jgi:1-acyl-sn-glycerol-3-phosphate acyltransferase